MTARRSGTVRIKMHVVAASANLQDAWIYPSRADSAHVATKLRIVRSWWSVQFSVSRSFSRPAEGVSLPSSKSLKCLITSSHVTAAAEHIVF